MDAIYDAVDVYDCKVINKSWGVANNDPFLKAAIDYADSKGVILVAAVALSIDGNLTSARFKQLLAETAEDLGDSGYDVKYGYGLVNVATLTNKLMQEINYYVSPVNVKNNEAYVLIKNNSETVLKASSIFSEYYNNKFVGCSPMPVTLNSGEETVVKIKSYRNRIVHYLWKELADLEPLVGKRESVQ